MPWEKSFDESTAVHKAMNVFWQKGFAATSLNDLISSTGINRGSLYNAFGGKRQLFVKTLLTYDQEHRKKILAELEALDNPKQSMTLFFDSLVKQTLADKEKKGCFLVNTALELHAHNDEINTIVRHALIELEAFFRRCIEVAQARHTLPTSIDPAVTATSLVGTVVAIRILGRGVYDKTRLQSLANQALDLLA